VTLVVRGVVRGVVRTGVVRGVGRWVVTRGGPQVVFQELVLASDVTRRLEELRAGRAADRIVSLVRARLADGPGGAGGETRSVGLDGVDPALEPVRPLR
jgi:hypothetical protein